MDRLAADPIGRTLLETFLAESGERALFGALPAVTERPSEAGAPPRRFQWLRWDR